MLSEHQAGKLLGARDTGIKIKGRRSTPGRYFHVAEPGTGWGGAAIADPLDIVAGFNPKIAWPGMTMLMVSTTGEQHAFYRLDETLAPVQAELPEALRELVERIRENCEPALCTVLFMAGAGGSLRAGVTENPVRLTRSVRAGADDGDGGRRAGLSSGRAAASPSWSTSRCCPQNAFGYVPTPAIVAPIEFTMRLRRLRRARRPCRRDQAARATSSRATRERATNVFVDGAVIAADAMRRAARNSRACPTGAAISTTARSI